MSLLELLLLLLGRVQCRGKVLADLVQVQLESARLELQQRACKPLRAETSLLLLALAQLEPGDYVGDDVVQVVQSLVDGCQRLEADLVGGRLLVRVGLLVRFAS